MSLIWSMEPYPLDHGAACQSWSGPTCHMVCFELATSAVHNAWGWGGHALHMAHGAPPGYALHMAPMQGWSVMHPARGPCSGQPRTHCIWCPRGASSGPVLHMSMPGWPHTLDLESRASLRAQFGPWTSPMPFIWPRDWPCNVGWMSLTPLAPDDQPLGGF